jgi:hypothetical protein
MEVRDCDWDLSKCEPKSVLYPIGSNEKQATHLAQQFVQWSIPCIERKPLTSMDGVGTQIGPDGTIYCFKRMAFSVSSRKYACWCLKLYRFKRRGRTRKAAGWGLIVASGAAAVVIPGGIFLHAWAATAGVTLITGAGTAAATIAAFIANGAQGVPVGLVKAGPPERCETREDYTSDQPTPLLEYEEGRHRVCKASGGDHEACR